MERIGKYEIRRVLGEGATSTVYLGYDPFAQGEVAIKRLHPELLRITDHTTLYHHLLLNEAALAGKLQHPHIVQIHDAVIEDNDAYVVMEYVPGGTLEAFTTPDNLLSFERLVEIVFKSVNFTLQPVNFCCVIRMPILVFIDFQTQQISRINPEFLHICCRHF